MQSRQQSHSLGAYSHQRSGDHSSSRQQSILSFKHCSMNLGLEPEEGEIKSLEQLLLQWDVGAEIVSFAAWSDRFNLRAVSQALRVSTNAAISEELIESILQSNEPKSRNSYHTVAIGPIIDANAKYGDMSSFMELLSLTTNVGEGTALRRSEFSEHVFMTLCENADHSGSVIAWPRWCPLLRLLDGWLNEDAQLLPQYDFDAQRKKLKYLSQGKGGLDHLQAHLEAEVKDDNSASELKSTTLPQIVETGITSGGGPLLQSVALVASYLQSYVIFSQASGRHRGADENVTAELLFRSLLQPPDISSPSLFATGKHIEREQDPGEHAPTPLKGAQPLSDEDGPPPALKFRWKTSQKLFQGANEHWGQDPDPADGDQQDTFLAEYKFNPTDALEVEPNPFGFDITFVPKRHMAKNPKMLVSMMGSIGDEGDTWKYMEDKPKKKVEEKTEEAGNESKETDAMKVGKMLGESRSQVLFVSVDPSTDRRAFDNLKIINEVLNKLDAQGAIDKHVLFSEEDEVAGARSKLLSSSVQKSSSLAAGGDEEHHEKKKKEKSKKEKKEGKDKKEKEPKEGEKEPKEKEKKKKSKKDKESKKEDEREASGPLSKKLQPTEGGRVKWSRESSSSTFNFVKYLTIRNFGGWGQIQPDFLTGSTIFTNLSVVELQHLPNLESIDHRFCKGSQFLTEVILYDLPKLHFIGDRFCANCRNLKSVNVVRTKNLVTIGGDFCASSTELVSLSLPPSLKNIGTHFLQACSSIRAVDLSTCTTLKVIGFGFASSCLQLRRVDLPASIENIGDDFLIGCSKLSVADLSHCSHLESIGGSFLKSCGDLTRLEFSTSPKLPLRIIGRHFAVSSGIRRLHLKTLKYLEVIGDGFCSQCYALSVENVSFPGSLKKIGGEFLLKSSKGDEGFGTLDLSHTKVGGGHKWGDDKSPGLKILYNEEASAEMQARHDRQLAQQEEDKAEEKRLKAERAAKTGKPPSPDPSSEDDEESDEEIDSSRQASDSDEESESESDDNINGIEQQNRTDKLKRSA